MIHSFRLRLALLSALLTGLVLAAFGFGSWWLLRNAKVERMESELRAYAERQAARATPEADWPLIESRILTRLGVPDDRLFLLLVQDGEGQAHYRSSRWPAGLADAQLRWPAPRPDRAAQVGGLIGTALAQTQDDRPLFRGPPPRGGERWPPPRDFERDPQRRDGASRPLPRDAGLGPPPRDAELGPLRRDAEQGPLRRPPPPRLDATRGDAAPGLRAARPALSDADSTMPPLPPRRAPVTPTDPLGDGLAPLSAHPPLAPAAALAPAAEPRSPPPAPPSAPTSSPPPPNAPPPLGAPPNGPPPQTASMQVVVEGTRWHIGLAATDRARVAIALDDRLIADDLRGTRNAFLAALPLALLLTGFGSWAFSRRALRPLERLTATAQRITAAGLDSRISATEADREFAQLIHVFNRMLERLERSFQQAHRFSADAAHELKTPLAILQGQLERAIAKAETGSSMQESLTGILDEVRRLSGISRKLLLLSQADAGSLRVHREPFDLGRVLEDLTEDTRMLAPHLAVSAQVAPDLDISADGMLLRQVLHNLVSNAIKYNLPGGWIRIDGQSLPGQVTVRVANASEGIALADRPRIFERFYRADPAHSRQVEGVGLGLAVSREIARAHGGDLLLNVADDGSVEFTLALPVLPLHG